MCKPLPRDHIRLSYRTRKCTIHNIKLLLNKNTELVYRLLLILNSNTHVMSIRKY